MMFGGGFDLSAWQAADSAAVQQHPATVGGSSASSLCFHSTASLIESGQQQTNRGPPSRAGDWTCEECFNVNFAKRTRCNKCGARKRAPQAGGDNSSTSGSNGDEPRHQSLQARGPLFKAGDWHCTHCGNVNWARRTKCNVCNGPKPNQDDEPRMGRGGGHFDLQNPEDRLSHDSEDEEYDEFGRKKKRRKRAGPTITTIKAWNKTPAGNINSNNALVSFSSTATKSDDVETVTATASSAPSMITLYFPPPPSCFLRGRTRSMASASSTSSDYEEIEEDDDDS